MFVYLSICNALILDIACLFLKNPGRSPRTAVVAALVDLALRVAAAVVAAGPEGRVDVAGALGVAALVAAWSSGLEGAPLFYYFC